MSDHTITACCLNMEALLREAVGLLPAEPDWKVRVIAELNRPPATPAAPPPGAGEGPYKPGFDLAFGKCVYRPFVLTVGVTVLLVVFILCAALMGAARHELATAIAEGRATVEKHTFADGTTDVRIIWK